MNKRLVAVMQRAIALCVACLAAGCSADASSSFNEPVRLSALEELLASSDMERFGSEDGASSLSRILSARLTPDRTRVVILDDAAPFLKVFRRDGELAVVAIQRGGGPAELSNAGAMAVSDDVAVVVGRATLMLAELTGARLRKLTPRLRLLDVGMDCGGRIVGYGPNADGRPRWVHSLRVDSAIAVEGSVYADSMPGTIGWGRGRSAIIGGPDGSVVCHRVPEGHDVVFFACDGTATAGGEPGENRTFVSSDADPLPRSSPWVA